MHFIYTILAQTIDWNHADKSSFNFCNLHLRHRFFLSGRKWSWYVKILNLLSGRIVKGHLGLHLWLPAVRAGWARLRIITFWSSRNAFTMMAKSNPTNVWLPMKRIGCSFVIWGKPLFILLSFPTVKKMGLKSCFKILWRVQTARRKKIVSFLARCHFYLRLLINTLSSHEKENRTLILVMSLLCEYHTKHVLQIVTLLPEVNLSS